MPAKKHTDRAPRRPKLPMSDQEHIDMSLFGFGGRKRLDKQQAYQDAEEQKSGWSLS